MSVFHPHTVRCGCGCELTVQLADSINVRRTPAIRAEILEGRLHQAACPDCNARMTVEKSFYYTDMDRADLYKVLPRGERHHWEKESERLDAAASLVPDSLLPEPLQPQGMKLRVLFGLDDLREKLVAEDADLDDRMLELLKVLLVHEHPVLLQRPRLRLHLQSVDERDLRFLAAYEHDSRRFEIRFPLDVAEKITAVPATLADWAGRALREDFFALSDHWVSMWRWSRQPRALARLAMYAKKARDGEDVAHDSKEFQEMLAALPRGSHLPAWAKKDLESLFDYARKHDEQRLQDSLFEIRYRIGLEDDWSMNDDPDDIDTLWKLLKDLPETHVEGNTKIREIVLDVGKDGGSYDPSTNDIYIGSEELPWKESFEDVVRHEVGHAVHEKRKGDVDPWLASTFGWRIFDTSDAEIDEWVGLMGGWGKLSKQHKDDIRGYLRAALGSGESWKPWPLPNVPAKHPWHGADFGPRLAYENTGENWYQNYATWYRFDSKAFFLNYWYGALMAVDETALELVAKMPSDYAAMSHYEFFAEVYALYYDLDDPMRNDVPSDVAKWIKENLGAPQPAKRRPAPPRPLKAWEKIVRPDGGTR